MHIESYAMIGDRVTCALAGLDGSIDWLCLPRFDSPACFAALLGDADNGRWLIAPRGASRTRRAYRGSTLREQIFGTKHLAATHPGSRYSRHAAVPAPAEDTCA